MQTRNITGLAALLAVCGLASTPTPALACSCMAVTPEQALAQHDAVFEGRVLSVETPEEPTGRVRATVEVVQQWKGVRAERVVVTTAAQSSQCGVGFQPDQSWLIYADRVDGELQTGICSRTRPIEQADEDLQALGAGVVPVDVGSEDQQGSQSSQSQPPARGGCASCAIGGEAPAAGSWLLALAAMSVLVVRTRKRRLARRGTPPSDR